MMLNIKIFRMLSVFVMLTVVSLSNASSSSSDNDIDQALVDIVETPSSKSNHFMTILEPLLHRLLKESELNIEINRLKEKSQLQDDLLTNATKEVLHLKKQVAHLTELLADSRIIHLNESNGILTANAVLKRRTRSVDGASAAVSSASSWSKLQISPDELGSMPYGHYGLNIYGHSGNGLQSTNATKRYYYTPICKLNHRSAVSSFNNVTRQPEVRFRIEMWNDAVEREVTKYTSGLVGHPVKNEQIRVLPLEKVLLSSQSPSPTNYQTSKVWSEYQRHRYLWFSLTCSQMVECDDLAAQMRSNPEQFGHLKLLFSLSSQTSERKETIIRIDNIVTGEMMTKLDQRYPDAKEVLLTADDRKQLLTESATNVIIEAFDDSSAVLSPNSEQMIYQILENLLVSSRVTIGAQSGQMWDSVFWNEDNYRPDKSAKTFNDVYSKLDKEHQNKLVTSFAESSKTSGSASGGGWGFSASASLNIEKSKSGYYSKEELDKFFQESKDTVQWDGEKFAPKPMTLSRINLAKLRDRQSFQERKVRVSYTNAMLSIAVNIEEQQGNQENVQTKDSTDPLIALKDQLFESFLGLKSNVTNMLKDFKTEVEAALLSANNKPSPIPIFAASTIRDNFPAGQYINYIYQVVGGEEDPSARNHGLFDPKTGLFTAKTSGVYLFLFHTLTRGNTNHVYLKVNEVIKAASATGDPHAETLVISAMMKIAQGDQVGVYLQDGMLHDPGNGYAQFSGLLLSY